MSSAEYEAKRSEAERRNKRRLIHCAPHEFKAVPSGRRHPKYQCEKCTGQVNASAYFWYMQGIEHARVQRKGQT